jgi:hypothetical protein
MSQTRKVEEPDKFGSPSKKGLKPKAGKKA